MSSFGPLLKWLTSLVGAVVVFCGTIFDDGKIDGITEWVTLCAGVAMAVNVYVVPNMHAGVGKYAKGINAVVIALAADVPALVLDRHLDANDWFTIVVDALVALGVLAVPNVGYVAARKLVGPMSERV